MSPGFLLQMYFNSKADAVFFLLLWFLGMLAFGFFTANVARKKGYNENVWFFGGFLFNFIALIAVAGLPLQKDACDQEKTERGGKYCPACAARIGIAAQVCRHCGHTFSREDVFSGIRTMIRGTSKSRLQALSVLKRMPPDDEVVACLKELVEYSDVWWKAMYELVETGVNEGVLFALKKGGFEHKEKAVNRLKRQPSAELADTLVSMLKEKPSVYTAHCIIRLFEYWKEPAAVPVLSGYLDDSNYQTMPKAVQALASIRDEAAIRALVSAYEKGVGKKEIASALFSIGAEAVPFLEEAAERQHATRLGKRINKLIEKIKHG